MFGGVDAVKEDLYNIKLLKTARLYAVDSMTPPFLEKIGRWYHKKLTVGGEALSHQILAGDFEHLERQLLKDKYLVSVDPNTQELTMTDRGMSLARGLAEVVPEPKALAVYNKPSVGTALQTWVRDARADLQTMTAIPFFLDKWWWRHNIWNFRKWWAGTNPEAQSRPLITVDRPQWSEEDELNRYQLWSGGHYSAFWLCPDGVQAGLEKLKAYEAKAVALGPQAGQVIDAVQAIAILSAQLPPPKPKTVVEQIQERMFDKSGDFKVEELQDSVGNVTRISWQSEPGIGKTYTLTNEQNKAFISLHDGKVEATEAAKKLADIQAGRDFDENTRKPRKKPKQFVLIDQFSKVYDAVEAGVPYRVGIPIENPCYLHAHECDCGKPKSKVKRPPRSAK